MTAPRHYFAKEALAQIPKILTLQDRNDNMLSCQAHVTEPVTVQVAPPLEEESFQILGATPRPASLGRSRS